MVLEQIMDQEQLGQFLDGPYGFTPVAWPQAARAIAGRATWQTLDEILATDGPDVLVSRDGRPSSFTAPLTAGEARRLRAEGHTVTVRHAERHAPALASLASEFEADFGSPVDVHLNATPAGCSGFGWHFDVEEVFVIQSAGMKRYRLRNNTVLPFPTPDTMPRELGFAAEVTPAKECVLAAGDLLYLPPGCWHVARAEEDSLSLAIGLLGATPLDLLDFMRRELAGRVVWRRRLPIAGRLAGAAPDVVVGRYREVLAEVAEELAAFTTAELIARFLSARQANLRAGRSGPER
jgi:hypothetical protein